jgi:hypothetical protein
MFRKIICVGRSQHITLSDGLMGYVWWVAPEPFLQNAIEIAVYLLIQAIKSCSLLLISTIIDMDASALFCFSNFI